MPTHRITNGMRSGGYSPPPGSEKQQSGYALCAVLSPPHLGQGTFAAQSPISCPKRRIPGTLCEMGAKIVRKECKNIIDRIKQNLVK